MPLPPIIIDVFCASLLLPPTIIELLPVLLLLPPKTIDKLPVLEPPGMLADELSCPPKYTEFVELKLCPLPPNTREFPPRILVLKAFIDAELKFAVTALPPITTLFVKALLPLEFITKELSVDLLVLPPSTTEFPETTLLIVLKLIPSF